MCRILVIPSGVTKKVALDILLNMYGNDEHDDGCGEVYINEGKFVVNKYSQSLKKVLKKGKPFLNHLPHSGNTLIHLRKASWGGVTKENAHPHVSLNGRIALIHNGTIPNVYLLSLYMQTIVGFNSNTDTACAGEIISRIGMRNWMECMEWGGVFCALNLDGSVEIAKVSGQLAYHMLPNKTAIIASEFDDEKYDSAEFARGWYHINADGTYKRHSIKRFYWGGYKKEETKVWNGVHYQKGNSDGLTPLIPARYIGEGGASARSADLEVWEGQEFCGC